MNLQTEETFDYYDLKNKDTIFQSFDEKTLEIIQKTKKILKHMKILRSCLIIMAVIGIFLTGKFIRILFLLFMCRILAGICSNRKQNKLLKQIDRENYAQRRDYNYFVYAQYKKTKDKNSVLIVETILEMQMNNIEAAFQALRHVDERKIRKRNHIQFAFLQATLAKLVGDEENYQIFVKKYRFLNQKIRKAMRIKEEEEVLLSGDVQEMQKYLYKPQDMTIIDKGINAFIAFLIFATVNSGYSFILSLLEFYLVIPVVLHVLIKQIVWFGMAITILIFMANLIRSAKLPKKSKRRKVMVVYYIVLVMSICSALFVFEKDFIFGSDRGAIHQQSTVGGKHVLNQIGSVKKDDFDMGGYFIYTTKENDIVIVNPDGSIRNTLHDKELLNTTYNGGMTGESNCGIFSNDVLLILQNTDRNRAGIYSVDDDSWIVEMHDMNHKYTGSDSYMLDYIDHISMNDRKYSFMEENPIRIAEEEKFPLQNFKSENQKGIETDTRSNKMIYSINSQYYGVYTTEGNKVICDTTGKIMYPEWEYTSVDWAIEGNHRILKFEGGPQSHFFDVTSGAEVKMPEDIGDISNADYCGNDFYIISLENGTRYIYDAVAEQTKQIESKSDTEVGIGVFGADDYIIVDISTMKSMLYMNNELVEEGRFIDLSCGSVGEKYNILNRGGTAYLYSHAGDLILETEGTIIDAQEDYYLVKTFIEYKFLSYDQEELASFYF